MSKGAAKRPTGESSNVPEIDELTEEQITDALRKLAERLDPLPDVHSPEIICKDDSLYQMNSVVDDDSLPLGEELASSLTEKNFEDETVQIMWENLPLKQRASMLTNFQCSVCLIHDALDLDYEQINKMTSEEELEAAKKAAELRKAGLVSPQVGIKQVEEIMISLGNSPAPSLETSGPQLMITGNCLSCGTSLTRTVLNQGLSLLGAMGSLVRTVKQLNAKPTARWNDPCPCGSGLKYKKCCGKMY